MSYRLPNKLNEVLNSIDELSRQYEGTDKGDIYRALFALGGNINIKMEELKDHINQVEMRVFAKIYPEEFEKELQKDADDEDSADYTLK